MAQKRVYGVLEFKEPVVLDDAWRAKHKDHILIWCKHTVFEGTKGVEYKECRCHTCAEIGREPIRETQTSPEKKPPKERKKRSLLGKRKKVDDSIPSVDHPTRLQSVGDIF